MDIHVIDIVNSAAMNIGVCVVFFFQFWFPQGICLVVGFPEGSDGKESAHNVGDLGSNPGLGRSPGEGKATHSSILGWRSPQTTVHGVAKSWT